VKIVSLGNERAWLRRQESWQGSSRKGVRRPGGGKLELKKHELNGQWKLMSKDWEARWQRPRSDWKQSIDQARLKDVDDIMASTRHGEKEPIWHKSG
jgi:hypothetical protein